MFSNTKSSYSIPLITLVFLSLNQYSILRHLIRPETDVCFFINGASFFVSGYKISKMCLFSVQETFFFFNFILVFPLTLQNNKFAAHRLIWLFMIQGKKDVGFSFSIVLISQSFFLSRPILKQDKPYN